MMPSGTTLFDPPASAAPGPLLLSALARSHRLAANARMCDDIITYCQSVPSGGSFSAAPAPARKPALLRGRRPPAELRARRRGSRRHCGRLLEKHLDVPLFDRRPRGVRLNRRGQAYLEEVRGILAEVHGVSERQRPVRRREDALLEETLYEEELLPVCSPALLAARGRPLLYDLGWDADWSYWFARQGEPTPDLSRASGFRLYSMLVQAAVHGIGAALSR